MPIVAWGRSARKNKRAVERENIGDIEGPILDCTAIIQVQNVPAEWVAKALVLRAAVHWKHGSVRELFDDLETVLKMSDAPAGIKKLAYQNKHTYLGRQYAQ
ncbi:MAG: hypothetical protein HY000_07460 [Planctomycetes bacterium]|nr:hypothetical protein [Planctomycetota bacterium]